jgi:hypothetical protein
MLAVDIKDVTSDEIKIAAGFEIIVNDFFLVEGEAPDPVRALDRPVNYTHLIMWIDFHT